MTLLTLKAHFIGTVASAVAAMAIISDFFRNSFGLKCWMDEMDEKRKSPSSQPSHLKYALKEGSSLVLPSCRGWILSMSGTVSLVPTVYFYSIRTDREVKKENGDVH